LIQHLTLIIQLKFKMMKTINSIRVMLLSGFLLVSALFFTSCSKEGLQEFKENKVNTGPALQKQAAIANKESVTSNAISTYDLRNQDIWWTFTTQTSRTISVLFEVLTGPKTAQVGMTNYRAFDDYKLLTAIGTMSTTAMPGNRLVLSLTAMGGAQYVVIIKTWYNNDNGGRIMQNLSRQVIKISIDQQMTVAIPGPVPGTFITGRLMAY
jgi:hypothetical protein